MASDHRAHARTTSRVYTRVHLRGRDNEASVGLAVPVRISCIAGKRIIGAYKRYKRRMWGSGGSQRDCPK